MFSLLKIYSATSTDKSVILSRGNDMLQSSMLNYNVPADLCSHVPKDIDEWHLPVGISRASVHELAVDDAIFVHYHRD